MTGRTLENSNLPLLIAVLKSLLDWTSMYSLTRMGSLRAPADGRKVFL